MSQELRADLHTHTLASDGTCTPNENVRLSKEAGLHTVAITDHDTVAGIREAVAAGEKYDIQVIAGVEISSVGIGQDIHVLGYFVPYENEEFEMELKKLRGSRHDRNILLIKRLNELGIDITLEKVYQRKAAKEGTEGTDKNIGRPHIAEELVEMGLVASMEEAFDKYLGKDGIAYVRSPRISPQEAIKLIRRFGGVSVLAHPGLYDNNDYVEELIVCGLDGIEVYHPDNSEENRQTYLQLAEDYGLVVTGGSDFHGWRGEEPFHAMIGSSTTTGKAVEQLKKLATQRQAQLLAGKKA